MSRVVWALVGAVSVSVGLGASAHAEPRNKNKTQEEAKPSIGDLFGEFKPGGAPEVAIKTFQQRARDACNKKKEDARPDMKYGFTPCADEAAASILEGDFFIAPRGGKLVSLEDVTVGMEGVTAVLRHVEGKHKAYYVYTGAVDPQKQNLASGGLMGVVHFVPDFNAQYAQYATKVGAPKSQPDGSFWFEANGGGVVVLRRFGESEAFVQIHARQPAPPAKRADVDDSVASARRPATPAPASTGSSAVKKKK